MKQAQIHLISGPIGAGKTTYALKLSDDLGCVCFSIDDWMVTLFGDDFPSTMDPAWIFPRVARCEKQIWSVARRLAKLGTSCVLDLGFQRAEHRRIYRKLINEAGLELQLHAIDADEGERWRRVEARNSEKGSTYRLTVTRQMFEIFEAAWSPPTHEEMTAMNGVRMVT